MMSQTIPSGSASQELAKIASDQREGVQYEKEVDIRVSVNAVTTEWTNRLRRNAGQEALGKLFNGRPRYMQ